MVDDEDIVPVINGLHHHLLRGVTNSLVLLFSPRVLQHVAHLNTSSREMNVSFRFTEIDGWVRLNTIV